MVDNSWLSRDCQSNSGCQGYSDRGVEEYRWLTIPGCPGIVRVTLVRPYCAFVCTYICPYCEYRHAHVCIQCVCYAVYVYVHTYLLYNPYVCTYISIFSLYCTYVHTYCTYVMCVHTLCMYLHMYVCTYVGVCVEGVWKGAKMSGLTLQCVCVHTYVCTCVCMCTVFTLSMNIVVLL